MKNSLSSDPLTLLLFRHGELLSKLLDYVAAEVLVNSINADKRIKGLQIGDHDIKIAILIDDTTILLRKDITCLKRIQVI